MSCSLHKDSVIEVALHLFFEIHAFGIPLDRHAAPELS